MTTDPRLTQEVLDKILDIAKSYPKDRGVTVEALMTHGFTDSQFVHAALTELEKQGKLAGFPLFYPIRRKE